jgi:hypothetical protein
MRALRGLRDAAAVVAVIPVVAVAAVTAAEELPPVQIRFHRYPHQPGGPTCIAKRIRIAKA